MIVINPVLASGGKVEVEVEFGPEFEGDDGNQINVCSDGLSSKFPFGLIGTIPSGSPQCPAIEFWGYSSQFCWLLDIYNMVSPAVVIVLLIQVVLHL